MEAACMETRRIGPIILDPPAFPDPMVLLPAIQRRSQRSLEERIALARMVR